MRKDETKMQWSSRSKLLRGLLPLVTVGVAAWGQAPAPFGQQPRPGSINYVEGQVSIGAETLNPAASNGRVLDRGQSLTTQVGKAEILLTPGVFLRLADNSTLKMVSPDLANTAVELERGRAIIEALDIHPANNIRVVQNGTTIRVVKKGLYDFDAADDEVRVVKGAAQVTAASRAVTVNGAHKATMRGDGAISQPYEPKQDEDEFYRWCSLRSGYLSEASVDAGHVYLGAGPGLYGPGWYGFGWYWSPWFGVYTYLPADGIFWSPFGWGFYSPTAVFWSPYRFYAPHFHAFREFHYPFGHGLPEPRRFGRR